MAVVTVGTKHQIVIPKEVRKKMSGLRPGSKVVVRQLDEETITVKTKPESWADRTRGIAAEAWKGIDTTKYLEDLRNEWDRKP